MAVKFYRCRHCGNVIVKCVDSKVPVVCCGEQMQELIPNTSEGSGEKRKLLCRELQLPTNLTAPAMLDAVNLLFKRDEFMKLAEKILSRGEK